MSSVLDDLSDEEKMEMFLSKTSSKPQNALHIAAKGERKGAIILGLLLSQCFKISTEFAERMLATQDDENRTVEQLAFANGLTAEHLREDCDEDGINVLELNNKL